MDRDAKKMTKQAVRYSAIGLQMGGAVVIGYTIGYYLDRWLHTGPYLKVFWTLAGVGAAFMAIYRAYKDAKRDMK